VYNLLDGVLATGLPVEVIRKGQIVKTAPQERLLRKTARKRPVRAMLEDPESHIQVGGLSEFSEWKKCPTWTPTSRCGCMTLRRSV
jgi:hypothetical protein